MKELTPLQKILKDPAFWSLILMNLLFIKYFNDHSGTFKTFLWIYWLQSVAIGLFNFLNILTLHEPIDINKSLPKKENLGNGCIAFFFLFHYGTFHLIYGVTLIANFSQEGIFKWVLFKYAAICILLNQLIWFIQQKIKQRKESANIGTLFFTPYLRIIPMHLTLILPAFYHVSAIKLFLALKIFLDVLMHLATTRWYWTNEKHVIGDIAQTDLL